MAGGREGELIRAFVAVTPGEDLLRRLTANLQALRTGPQGDTVRWVRPENLHVTLRFLGNLPATAVGPLQEGVAAELAGTPSFTMSTGPIGLFPSHRHPRALAAQLQPEAPLAGLAEAVELGVVAAGLPGEQRRFRAHLTLGRVKRNAPRSLNRLVESVERINQGGAGGREGNDPGGSAGADLIRKVELFRSDLRPDGPVYTTLWTIPLA